MTLQKLTITPQPPSHLGRIEALFNPTQYTISKPVMWGPPEPPTPRLRQRSVRATRKLNAPLLQFQGGGSRVLSLRLFFDVTESPKVDGRPVDDVRQLTNKFVALTLKERVSDKDEPPVCLITWGGKPLEHPDFPFKGVVTSLEQEFVLFKSDGTPVRANLTVVFTERISPSEDLRKTDPEFTIRVVKRGDTLSGIAAEAYRDPSLWRVIADASNLDDPRRLEIGRTLNIPKLR